MFKEGGNGFFPGEEETPKQHSRSFPEKGEIIIRATENAMGKVKNDPLL